jgi:Skp family chaperone for outer membrane proteins
MKKLFAIATIMVALMSAGTTKVAAQNKMGYFDLDYVVSLMPGIGKVDTLLQSFERDSLAADFQFNLSEYKRIDSTYRVDSLKNSPRVREQLDGQRNQLGYILQNWQQYSQQAIQAKQQELTAPYLKRAVDAFQAVVNDGKYTYVFKRDALWQAPPSDNLIIPVLRKLNIKVPDELQPQGQGAPAGAAPRTGTAPARRQ